MQVPTMTKTEFAALYRAADAAGKAAAEAKVPTPMVVGTPKNMMASIMGGDDGGFDPKKPVYHVSGGVCGFAWISVKPGNSAFANWLRKRGYARTDSYAGGVSINVHGYGQSYEKKVAYARAFAKVLRDAGFDRVYAQDRID